MKMHLFKLTYRESRDSETQTCNTRGYDADHALERFLDSEVEEGAGYHPEKIVSVVKLKPRDTPPAHSTFLFQKSRR